MALKATIFKVDLSIADMDRSHYADYSLTLARHPSENDVRMMVRLLAFMRYADDALTFGRGLSSDDEPDLWQKDITGAIRRWIVVGQPDERWLRKASGRAVEVVVFCYGDRAVDVWWEQNRETLGKLPNLSVFRLTAGDAQQLALLVARTMNLQCLIQDAEMLITGDGGSLRISPALLFSSNAL